MSEAKRESSCTLQQAARLNAWSYFYHHHDQDQPMHAQTTSSPTSFPFFTLPQAPPIFAILSLCQRDPQFRAIFDVFHPQQTHPTRCVRFLAHAQQEHPLMEHHHWRVFALPGKSIEPFLQMRDSDFQPDVFALPLLLRACTGARAMNCGVSVHRLCVKMGTLLLLLWFSSTWSLGLFLMQERCSTECLNTRNPRGPCVCLGRCFDLGIELDGAVMV